MRLSGVRNRLTVGISLVTVLLVGITPFTDVTASSAVQELGPNVEADAVDPIESDAPIELGEAELPAVVDANPSEDMQNETSEDEKTEEPTSPSESMESDDVEHSLNLSAEESPGFRVMSVPNFNSNPNVFYTLDRSENVTTSGITSWVSSRTPVVSIRRLTFDPSATIPVHQSNIVMGGPRELTALRTTGSSIFSPAPAVRGSNSLGVAPDGVFYFTTQDGAAAQVGAVDVWRYEMMSMPGEPYNPAGVTCAAGGAPTGSQVTGFACAPQRVYSNMSLNSPTGGTIVGGAYNPRDGFFYFMYYSGTPAATANPSDNPYGAGNVRAHLYRYEPTNGVAGEVAHFDIRKHTSFGDSYNGDIAFDSVGNLLLTVSNNGSAGNGNASRGRIMLASFEYSQFASLPTVTYTSQYQYVPTLTPVSTVGAYGQPERLNALNNDGVNGLAYTSTGHLVTQQGSSGNGGRISLVDPADYTTIGNVRTNTTATGSFVDLATSTAPPVLTVQKNVEGGRYAPGDQFTLSGNQQLTATNIVFDPVTTQGNEPGIQSGQIGPLPLQAGGDITVRESITANAENYSSSYECFLENSDGTKGTVFRSGEGRTVTFNYLSDVPGAQSGPQQMKCVFTNGPLRPNLATTKTADPVSTSAVQAGETVQYKLTFDNSTGQAPATVNHIDYLADVLDDATFVGGSIRYGDGTESAYADAQTSPLAVGITASSPNANEEMLITGTVPPASIRTVWFEVQVKAHSDERPNPNSGVDFMLNNYLRPSNELPPAECLSDDPNCTTHPVQAWTIDKKSRPADGSLIHAGGNVNYVVTVAKVNQGVGDWDLNDVTVTDDLTDVLKAAGWSPDATVPSGAKSIGLYLYDTATGDTPVETISLDELTPSITPGTGEAPYFDSEWTLTVPEFSMPGDIVRAEIWYTVTAGLAPVLPGQWEPGLAQSGTSFTNYATANTPDVPPLQCVTGDEDTFNTDECQVTHRIEDGFFTIRKDGVGAGARSVEMNLTGHAFEIRDDNGGEMSAEISDQMCTTQAWEDANFQGMIPDVPWNVDPASYEGAPLDCAYLYPIESGEQEGRWRSQFMPAGDYWLIETRAPEGHQLLAEPIKFSVGDIEQEGRLTVYDNSGEPLPSCSNEENAQNPTACVNPTGWLMVIQDPRMLTLPLAGGVNLATLMTGTATLLLIGIIATGIVLRRRNSLRMKGNYVA